MQWVCGQREWLWTHLPVGQVFCPCRPVYGRGQRRSGESNGETKDTYMPPTVIIEYRSISLLSTITGQLSGASSPSARYGHQRTRSWHQTVGSHSWEPHRTQGSQRGTASYSDLFSCVLYSRAVLQQWRKHSATWGYYKLNLVILVNFWIFEWLVFDTRRLCKLKTLSST